MNRKFSLLLVVALVVLGAFAGPVMADAPDPIPSNTYGKLVTNPNGSRTLTVWGGKWVGDPAGTTAGNAPAGTIVEPGWRWTTHGHDCNTDRAGAGYSIVWNDPTQLGNLIAGGNLGDFYVGTPSDNTVHSTPIQTIPGAVNHDVMIPSQYASWRGGCGVYVNHPATVLPDGSTKSGYWSEGVWGPISHTYPASVKGPISVCPVTYDVHGSDQNTAPNGEKEVTAGGSSRNGDNSIQSNGSTPQGNGCFATRFGTPHLSLTKEVSADNGASWSHSVSVHTGAQVLYRFVIKNDGDLDLSGVHVNELTGIADCDSSLHNVSGGSTLSPGQTAVWQCSHTMGSGDLTNVANASGTDANNQGVQSNNDQADVHVLHPGIDVNKQAAEQAVLVGQTIHYTVTVSNTGNTALTVSPSDTGCDGFNSGAFTLQPGASQTLNCSHTATAADASAYVNRACASGSDSSGGSVSDCDSVSTPIQHPAIAIDKSGPASAQAGDAVAYTLTVTDPGDTSFAESSVQVTDPQCNGAPVTLIGKGGDPSPGTLNPGDVWTYTCSVQTTANDTAIHNVATVVGTDTAGHTVKASDDADTTLAPPQQAVLGERIAPGTAKLLGPTGCVAKAFNARVKGTKIATVTFVLDGKVVKRFTKPVAGGVYALRVNPKSMKLGVHRIVVNITFRSGSATKPKSLRLSFQRCAKKLAQPRFTG